MLRVTNIQSDDYHFLVNMERHLLNLADDAAQISKIVSELTDERHSTLKLSTIRNLQKLDSLEQSLGDLAGLCAALSGPEEHRARAVGDLKLAATRTLVAQTPGERCTIAQGSVDIF